jgi:hypothetical protein
MIVVGSSFRCGFVIKSIAQAIEEWHKDVAFTDQRMEEWHKDVAFMDQRMDD